MAEYLRYQDLRPVKGITFSRQHIGRLQKALKFPLSVPFGDNTEVFIGEEIDQWIADRIAERDAKAAALAAHHSLLESRPAGRAGAGGHRKSPQGRPRPRKAAPASPPT